MECKVLAVGDVVGNPGMDRVCRSLRYLKRKTQADFVIVNDSDINKLSRSVSDFINKFLLGERN